MFAGSFRCERVNLLYLFKTLRVQLHAHFVLYAVWVVGEVFINLIKCFLNVKPTASVRDIVPVVFLVDIAVFVAWHWIWISTVGKFKLRDWYSTLWRLVCTDYLNWMRNKNAFFSVPLNVPVEWINTLLVSPEVAVQISISTPVFLCVIFRIFCHPLQADARISPWSKPRPLHSASFPVHVLIIPAIWR